jgi:hypothetical protein
MQAIAVLSGGVSVSDDLGPDLAELGRARRIVGHAGAMAGPILTTDCLIAQAPEPRRDGRGGETSAMPAF